MPKNTCINHPARAATFACKRCGTFLCSECRLISGGSVFCGPECAAEFQEFQSAMDTGFRQKGGTFSFFGCLRTMIISCVLIAIICGVLVYWLGTISPSEMIVKLEKMMRLLF